MAHSKHTHEQMAIYNSKEIAHYAREIVRMLEAGEPLMPWQANLLAKCRSSIGEVKHRMETRSGAIGQPVSAMNRAATGQPISAMNRTAGMSGDPDRDGHPDIMESGLSGSQRIAKMRAKNANYGGHKGGTPYRRYMKKKSAKK